MQSNKSFADVENSWAKDEINELLGKGIIDETASFDPEETITREEFTTWVARAYGLVDDEADAPFTDLPQDHDHYSELASAYNA
ncbi:S-layer homology domain-containing protein, partial [Aduncisulcus paluster]